MGNYNYKWANLTEVKKRHGELNIIINRVRDDLKDILDIQPSFRVGSGGRHMATELVNGNVGFDLDCNLKVSFKGTKFDATQIRNKIMDSFTVQAKVFGYSPAEDKSRVFTIAIKEKGKSEIIFSCDFAILRELDNGTIQIVHFDKEKNTYQWGDETKPYRLMEKEELYCKSKIGLWQKVRDYYLERKDFYGPTKPSIEIYLESLDAIARKNGFKDK